MNRKLKKFIAIIFVVFMSFVFIFSAFQLYRILSDYKHGIDLYNNLKAQYISEETVSTAGETAAESPGNKEDEDGSFTAQGEAEEIPPEDIPPFQVDWDELKKVNEDVIGWIYVEGVPDISYPIVQTTDDSYYVNHTIDREESRNGSIFLTCRVKPDLSSPHSIIYGHNMKNDTMFSQLANMRNQEMIDQYPYFWVLTPSGNYRYEIFSAFETNRVSDVFQTWDTWSDEFTAWTKDMQARSLFQTAVTNLSSKEHIVTLCTCVPNSYNRTVILGRCCSKRKPGNP